MNKSDLPHDEFDAIALAIVAVEEFCDLPLKALPPEARAGACMLFAAIVGRVKDKLPRNAQTEYIFPIIEDAEQAAWQAAELFHLKIERQFPALDTKKH